MIDPGTAMLVASAISAAVKGAEGGIAGQAAKKQSKRNAKQAKRETYSGLLQDALGRSAELEAHRMGSSQKLGKRRTQSMLDTSELVRGAMNI